MSYSDYYSEADNHAQEMQDEYNAQFGDPRKCPVHPHVHTSSADGMFDAPCGACEAEMDQAEEQYRQEDEKVRWEALSEDEQHAEAIQAAYEKVDHDAREAARMAAYEAEYGPEGDTPF